VCEMFLPETRSPIPPENRLNTPDVVQVSFRYQRLFLRKTQQVSETIFPE
jgi:hypothetical protein